MTVDLDKLDALAAAATPGPWTAEKYEPYDDEWSEDTYGWWVNGPEWAEGSGEFRNFTGPNAAFIAACDPSTIRELVAAVRERDELRAALISEDEIAHGEAWEPSRGGLGICAYCDDEWPCRTQRGINRALHPEEARRG